MTAFTPDLRIEYLPPGKVHTDPRIVVTDWVDYSISATRGVNQYIDSPYPMSSSVSLLFDEDVIPNITLGSWIVISAYNSTTLDYAIVHSGYVTDISSSYRFHGMDGYILEWQYSLTSAISILQNTTWYNPAQFTDTTMDCVDYINSYFGTTMWNEVNAETQWNQYGPLTWDEVDAFYVNNLPTIYVPTDYYTQVLTTGYRNVWDDYVKLVYGVYGFIYEDPDGSIIMKGTSDDIFPSFTVTQSMLNTDIRAGYAVDQLRNEVTMVEWDDVSSTYYEDASVAQYNERSGTLDTLLTNTTDAATIAQRILAGLAYPLLHTNSITLNLLNPIFTDAQRNYLLFEPLGWIYEVEAPVAMGATLDYLSIGCTYEITKDAFLINLNLVPLSQVKSTPNWEQISYDYTWDLYAIDFPTQEWQDL